MISAGTIISFITGAVFGAVVTAFLTRMDRARKRDELGYMLSPVVAHDPEEIARMVS